MADIVPPPGAKGGPILLRDMALQSPEDVDIRGGRIVRLREFAIPKGSIDNFTAAAATITALTLAGSLFTPSEYARLDGADFTGAVTMASTLAVTGATTLSEQVTINGATATGLPVVTINTDGSNTVTGLLLNGDGTGITSGVMLEFTHNLAQSWIKQCVDTHASYPSWLEIKNNSAAPIALWGGNVLVGALTDYGAYDFQVTGTSYFSDEAKFVGLVGVDNGFVRVGSLAGSYATFNYLGQLSLNGGAYANILTGTAVGDVVGPASSVNNNIAVFDGLTGKLIKDGGAALSAYLLSSSYTAADVLSKLLTVDGAGSLLDADTLDTYHASAFPRLSSNNTFSGTNTFQNSTYVEAGVARGVTNSYLYLNGGNFGSNIGANLTAYGPAHATKPGWFELASDNAATSNTLVGKPSGSASLLWGGYEVLTTYSLPGNSLPSATLVTNLNADLLDNQEGSYYRNASNINAGTIGNSYVNWASPGAIGSTSPSTGVFTASLNVGSNRTTALTVNGTYGGGIKLVDTGEIGLWASSSGAQFNVGFNSGSTFVGAFAISSAGAIATGNPGGGSGAWMLGTYTGTILAISGYVETKVDGTVRKLAVVT